MQYITMFIIAFLYIGLLHTFKIQNTFFKNLDLIKFMVLTPMLVSAFIVDLKHRIIPNRLNMTIFECGILFTFIYGINNITVAKNMIFGLIVGAGIFIAITLLGGLIAGKEAMGLRRCKVYGSDRTFLWRYWNSRDNTCCIFYCSNYFNYSSYI